MGRTTRVKHSVMFIAAFLAATVSLTPVASAAGPLQPHSQTGSVILWITSHHDARQNKQSSQLRDAHEGVDTGGVILWFKTIFGTH